MAYVKKSAFPNLYAEMSRSGITEEDIATLLDKNKGTVESWLSGTTAPTIKQAWTIWKSYFPTMPLEYLYAPEPLYINLTKQDDLENVAAVV